MASFTASVGTATTTDGDKTPRSRTASVGTATTTDGDKTPRSRTASVGEATVEAGVRVKKIPEAVEATYVYRSGKNLVVTRRS